MKPTIGLTELYMRCTTRFQYECRGDGIIGMGVTRLEAYESWVAGCAETEDYRRWLARDRNRYGVPSL